MDPRGQVQDLQSIRQCGLYEPNSMSPEVCLELVNALNAPQGKGIFKTVRLSSFFEILKAALRLRSL